MAKNSRIKREQLRTEKTIEKLCAAGLSRSANLSKKQFLRSIGRPEATNTEQAERETILNLAIACLKSITQINTKIEYLQRNIQYVKGE